MYGRLISRESAFFALVLLLAAGTPVRGQTNRGDYGAADIAYGARLYTTHCAQCHGATGDSVGTVNLRSGRLKNASTDQQLVALLARGIPGTGMPAFKFDNAEQVGIVAYLRNMNTFDAASVPVGNADRGRALFEGKGGCRTCHQVDGRGAGLAPDLGDIGAIRTAAALQAAILDPSAAMLPINRPVRAVTKNGRTVNGRRLNEDTFTVQLMDDRGALLSLAKDDLREYRVLTQSPMPAYSGKLTSAEVADLVAHLLTLKGG
jgi:putative heme-binding domain-containing protein